LLKSHPPDIFVRDSRESTAVLLAGMCFYAPLMGRAEPVTDPPARSIEPTAADVRPAE